MPIERRVNDLIAAGWRARGPDSGAVAVQHWSRKVFDCMTAVHGRITFTPDISNNCARQGEKKEKEQ